MNVVRHTKSRIAAFGVALALLSMQAMAALPAGVAAAATEMESDFESLFGMFFPVLITIVVSFLAWRYTKKLGNKV